MSSNYINTERDIGFQLKQIQVLFYSLTSFPLFPFYFILEDQEGSDEIQLSVCGGL